MKHITTARCFDLNRSNADHIIKVYTEFMTDVEARTGKPLAHWCPQHNQPVTLDPKAHSCRRDGYNCNLMAAVSNVAAIARHFAANLDPALVLNLRRDFRPTERAAGRHLRDPNYRSLMRIFRDINLIIDYPYLLQVFTLLEKLCRKAGGNPNTWFPAGSDALTVRTARMGKANRESLGSLRRDHVHNRDIRLPSEKTLANILTPVS